MIKEKENVLTGFDTNASNKTGRLLNKDGVPNVTRVGTNFFERFSIYHTLLNLSFKKYLILILIIYLIINLAFAFIYFLIGAENLGISPTTDAGMSAFTNCFFFSAQTLTTVGYGRVNPTAFNSSLIAALESLLGLLLFSLITGLSYARFAKPQSKIMFSKNMVITPFKDNYNALMFRIVSPTKHQLTDVVANMTLAMTDTINGKNTPAYLTLKLETEKIISFPLNWTLVHLINEESPLYKIDFNDFEKKQLECIIHLKAYDENYSNHVQQRSSYLYNEIINNAKFAPMFYRNDEDGSFILEIDKLSKYDLL